MIKKLIMFLLVTATVKVGYAQQATPGTMPMPYTVPGPVMPPVSSNPTSFSNMLQRFSTDISTNDLELVNSNNTVQPVVTPTIPTGAPQKATAPSSSSD
jgi:hypothetical protein